MSSLADEMTMRRGQVVFDLAARLLTAYIDDNGCPIYDPAEAVEVAAYLVGFACSDEAAGQVDQARRDPATAYRHVVELMHQVAQRAAEARAVSVRSQAETLWPFASRT